jgi:glycosyltransferase involved in cell wall biosynthesis
MERVRFWMNGVVKEDIEAARERRTNASTNPTSSVDRARPSVATQRAPLRLLTASRLVEWKRVDRVLDVLAQLPADVPTWTLEIAGDGPERSALVEMACRLGLADRVKFLGPISHDEVMDRLVQADAYLSLYDLSNLSNGVLEAAVAGVPVFALDVGGTSHLVEDGVTGVLVRPDRLFDDGTRRLARLLSDDSWRAKLSGGALEAGRTRIRTWEQRMQLEITEVEALLASR